jgi:hypothetical protein
MLHRLTTDQPAPHHDKRISKRRSTTYDQYIDPGILAPGKSEVFVITSTPKKYPEEAKTRSD